MGMYLGRMLRDVDILRVSLEASEANSTQGVVVFELFLSGVRTARVEVLTSEIELPENLKQVANRYIYRHPSFELPESVKTALLNGMADRVRLNEPLWLEVEPPGNVLARGYARGLLLPDCSRYIARGSILRTFPLSTFSGGSNPPS